MVKFEFALCHLWPLSSSSSSPFAWWFRPNPLSNPKYTLLIFSNKNKASEETLISGSFPPPPNQYLPGLGVETLEP